VYETSTDFVHQLLEKKAFIYPFQKVSKISITPFDFSMALQAMTIEKLKFSLPAVFTIGPADSPEALEKSYLLESRTEDPHKRLAGASSRWQRDAVTFKR
jgi:hypothetical protein